MEPRILNLEAILRGGSRLTRCLCLVGERMSTGTPAGILSQSRALCVDVTRDEYSAVQWYVLASSLANPPQWTMKPRRVMEQPRRRTMRASHDAVVNICIAPSFAQS